MKLLYCVFDCTSFGGTERTLALQTSYFAEHGHDVAIATTEIPAREERAYHFSDKISFYNLGIHYAEVDGSLSPCKIARRIQKGKEHKRKLKALIQELKPDIVVSLFSHEMSFLNDIKGDSLTVAQLHFSKPYRSIESRLLKKPLLARWFMLLKEWRKKTHIPEYDAFVVLTHEDAANWNLDNIHVVSNALPFLPDKLAPLEQKRVITVGRLNVQKGYDHLLAAWNKVAVKHPDWTLDIYGSGEEQGRLEQQMADYGLKNVVIHPPVADIRNKYMESSLYVMSSLYAGFGIVLIEAMACGLPCVSYACPCGPTDIISEGKDGFLVPVGDQDGLADRICRLIENRELRQEMGKAAATNVLRYSEENIMHAWERLFAQLLQEKKS